MEHVELQGLSIVLVGAFNPAIFNPNWLAAQSVIKADEAADATVEVVHREIAQFTVGDLIFEITQDKFSLHTAAEPFVKGADVVMEIFGVALPHTPINAMGINYMAHFRVQSRKQQTALGRALAPVEPWGEWGAKVAQTETSTGGMTSLTMMQVEPGDRVAGNIAVTVQPSHRLQPPGTGVYVQINDHYEAGPDASVNFPELCVAKITPSLERSRQIVDSLSTYARSL